jgi:arabinose-5-phosphate isomerase
MTAFDTAPDAHDEQNLRQLGRAVIEAEARAVTAMGERIGPDFARACHLMLTARGRVIILGMGKSGHIASKIAATLASTGTPAFYVHPGEASHGDVGMITGDDVVLALSQSGETEEIAALLPLIKRLAVPLIALTGNPGSTLGQASSVVIDVSVEQEACPLGLAPTSSTTACLAMGDALAIAILDARGFTQADFARSHPGGRLGRRLLVRIDDVMHSGERLPWVHPGTRLADALIEMSNKGLGMTAVVDQDQRLLGVFTDGDLRRALDRAVDFHSTAIENVMTPGGRHVPPDHLAAEALELMERHCINALLVVDDQQRLVGALNMHDLLRAGVA